jgi:hypothetical protein
MIAWTICKGKLFGRPGDKFADVIDYHEAQGRDELMDGIRCIILRDKII